MREILGQRPSDIREEKYRRKTSETGCPSWLSIGRVKIIRIRKLPQPKMRDNILGKWVLVKCLGV